MDLNIEIRYRISIIICSVKHATPVVLGIVCFRKLRYGIWKDTLRYLLRCDPQKGGTELNESK